MHCRRETLNLVCGTRGRAGGGLGTELDKAARAVVGRYALDVTSARFCPRLGRCAAAENHCQHPCVKHLQTIHNTKLGIQSKIPLRLTDWFTRQFCSCTVVELGKDSHQTVVKGNRPYIWSTRNNVKRHSHDVLFTWMVLRNHTLIQRRQLLRPQQFAPTSWGPRWFRFRTTAENCCSGCDSPTFTGRTVHKETSPCFWLSRTWKLLSRRKGPFDIFFWRSELWYWFMLLCSKCQKLWHLFQIFHSKCWNLVNCWKKSCGGSSTQWATSTLKFCFVLRQKEQKKDYCTTNRFIFSVPQVFRSTKLCVNGRRFRFRFKTRFCPQSNSLGAKQRNHENNCEVLFKRNTVISDHKIIQKFSIDRNMSRINGYKLSTFVLLFASRPRCTVWFLCFVNGVWNLAAAPKFKQQLLDFWHCGLKFLPPLSHLSGWRYVNVAVNSCTDWNFSRLEE